MFPYPMKACNLGLGCQYVECSGRLSWGSDVKAKETWEWIGFRHTYSAGEKGGDEG